MPAKRKDNYFAKTNDVVSKPREALTVGQQEKFINFVYSSHIYSRLGNLFTVLLGTGLRIVEDLALTWDDIDFDFCTRMCEQDVNLKVLQDIMGHRNICTTMEVYAKATREKKQDVIKELNGKFKIS